MKAYSKYEKFVMKRRTAVNSTNCAFLGLAVFSFSLLPAVIGQAAPKERKSAKGPLIVHPDNRRYLMVKGDPARKAVLLSGSHTWAEFQTYQKETFDYIDWIDKLKSWDHNFMRGWHWEDGMYSPLPYAKVGDKYDLTKYNPVYFNRLKKRIKQAAERDLYVSVMLFEGWSLLGDKHGRQPLAWPSHPFDRNNNIQRINGDLNGDGKGFETHTLLMLEVTRLQEAYVRHCIDEFNHFDNIIWEIANESAGSAEWQYHMIDFIKKYESTKPKQHLVWMNYSPDELFDPNCHADIVSPGGDRQFIYNPPATTGQKVVVADSDHLSPLSSVFDNHWKWFTRGMHPILMDCKYQGLTWWTGRDFHRDHPKWQKIRDALGTIREYSQNMDLVNIIPQKDPVSGPASTGYCLYKTGAEYLVFQPEREKTFTVDLSAGEYYYEWIIPTTGKERIGTIKAAGGKQSFKAPFPWPSAVYIKKM